MQSSDLYSNESHIRWLAPPSSFAIVRERITDSGSRGGKLSYHQHRVVAYAVLRPNARRRDGRFWRRFWYVKDHDLPTGAPSEGVYPDSIRAGHPSRGLGAAPAPAAEEPI